MKREELQAVIDQAKALQESYLDHMQVCARLNSTAVILAALIASESPSSLRMDYLVKQADDLAARLEVQADIRRCA